MRPVYAAAVFFGAALAQQPLWGQCGGKDWTGSTTCVSGSHCQYSNEWYSQCVPGEASSATTVRTSTSTRTTTRAPTSTRTSVSPGATGFATTSGTKFTIGGQTKYFAGTNSYWISFLANRADVDKALDDVANSGLKILRVWGFNDVTSNPGSSGVYFQHLSSSGSTINTGSNGLQRLDYVVAAAEARGISLIIPFVNYWDDYGGMAAYVSAFGGSKTSWYTNSAAQAQYRRYISAVVSRYRNSPAIFAWELANEPRCAGCSTDVIYNWASSTSQYVKSLDSNHMVTLGDEGFGLPGDGSYPYQYVEGVDFVKNLGISTLDFGTLHLYPSHWGTSYDWGNGWIKAHGAACAQAGKPCLLEEYGAPGDHCSRQRPWQQTSVATNGMGGDSFWQFGTTLSSGQTHDDTFTIYVGDSDWACLVTNHVAAIG
ncbi:fungal cellulose binding domain-containing protein [Stachybotrys elegans]|uniref:Mannan endo-1,4-beta-mannosidase A n=1 Tax=Stachybotrys elegans TaxID=80388 RepID=A0A8K0WPW7_9HYPO|nr:fungal cellulose binding domain-containing protein [Stachybotrys elegans]